MKGTDLILAIFAGFCIGVAFGYFFVVDPLHQPKPAPASEIWTEDSVLQPTPPVQVNHYKP